MRKIFRVIKYVVFAVALMAVGAFGFHCYESGFQTKEISADSVERIEEYFSGLSEFTTLEYNYIKSEEYEDWLEFFDIPIPAVEKHLILEYNGVLTYATNLSMALIELVDNDLVLTIPSSKIVSHEIDEDSWELVDKDGELFDMLKPERGSDVRKVAKKKVEARAKQIDLLSRANKNAVEQVTRIAESICPELDVKVIVE